ncbi:unnamed protein product [Lactuca virosa]|uniref:Uncharacterized protein n=1 Tax=Lactuca virosa TaxID=75947 RepID=A0AAU9NYY6_9ASTR|nr:unnamed protein product [Lactuca virosa]
MPTSLSISKKIPSVSPKLFATVPHPAWFEAPFPLVSHPLSRGPATATKRLGGFERTTIICSLSFDSWVFSTKIIGLYFNLDSSS